MRYEWDDQKNQINVRKHGFTFEETIHVFSDPNCLTWIDERYSYGEIRKITIGKVTRFNRTIIIVVVHTERKEAIRIISARPANKKERRRYHEQVSF